MKSSLLKRAIGVLSRHSPDRFNHHVAGTYSARARNHLKEGDYESAIQHFSKAISLDPKDPDTYHSRSKAYSGLGQFERALKDQSVAILLDSMDAQAHNERGNEHLNSGRFQLALEDYEEAIRLDPEFAWAHAGRALAFTHLGIDGDARQAAKRAIELGFDPIFLTDRINELQSQHQPTSL